MNVTKHLKIFGKVQGVFFRESMARQSIQLGIRGWVRNRSDGTVEAMVSGTQDAVTKIIEWAHHGPEAAKVDRVVCSPGRDEFRFFEKLPTI